MRIELLNTFFQETYIDVKDIRVIQAMNVRKYGRVLKISLDGSGIYETWVFDNPENREALEMKPARWTDNNKKEVLR